MANYISWPNQNRRTENFAAARIEGIKTTTLSRSGEYSYVTLWVDIKICLCIGKKVYILLFYLFEWAEKIKSRDHETRVFLT